ncbi:TetR/AcrR family transcriptional regulator [Dermacoccaceae bacterium W4C1]
MRADAQANRDAVVRAARVVIAADGAEASLTKVASEAGVGIATLYRNFPTRQDLLVEVTRDIQGEVAALLEGFAEADPRETEQRWPELVRRLAAIRPGTLTLQVAQWLERNDAPRAQALREGLLPKLGPVLDKAKVAGLVRADVEPFEFVVGLAAATRALPEVELVELAGGQRLERFLIEVFLRGLRPD